MIIRNLIISELGDITEVSADVDQYRLWYRLPSTYQVHEAGSPFLAAALLPAMLRGEKLEIDGSLPVSARLLKNIRILQEIHHCWNPIFKIIPIEAKTFNESSLNAGVASFFSGGVDSTYTFLKHLDEITHLIFIQGFDFYFNRSAEPYLAINDISDLSQIAYKIITASDSVSAYIKSRISPSTLKALSYYLESYLPTKTVEELLVRDLNEIIMGELIYDPDRFSNIKLRAETKALLDSKNLSNDYKNINRLLLEDAFPLEIAKGDIHSYKIAIKRNQDFTESFGKRLIPIETNHFAFGYRYNLSRNLTQGSALASIALLLGYPRVYIPAAYSYRELIPLGSHPLTDPLYSSEGVDIQHDGAEVSRVDKIVRIAEYRRAVDNLRVCFDDMNTNCGICSKCIRTIIPLMLLNVSDIPFKNRPSLNYIKKMSIGNPIEMIFFEQNYELAIRTGNRELRKALKKSMHINRQKHLLKEFDSAFLSGLLRYVIRLIKKDYHGISRIDTMAKSS